MFEIRLTRPAPPKNLASPGYAADPATMFRIPSSSPPSSVGIVDRTVLTPCATTEKQVTNIDASIGLPAALESSVPEAGSTYIIQHTSTGKVLTFQGGKILLGDVGGHYTFRWKCEVHKGWYGFRDPASHMYLGHDGDEMLRCRVYFHKGWEWFCLRPLRAGGYNLLMRHGPEELRPVGLQSNRKDVLFKIENWSDAAVWQFIKV